MPFDGSGNYSPAPAPNFPAVGGTVISSAYYNNVINDIATALSNTLTRDGQGKPTADQNWNGRSLTNVNNLGAVTATFSGAVTLQSTVAVTGAITANGGISATTGAFSGGLTGTTLNLSGALTGQAISGTTADFTGNINARSTIYVGSSLVQNIAADATTLYLRGGNVAFQDAAATSTRMYLDSNGNLGIGTTVPLTGYRITTSGGGIACVTAAGANFDVQPSTASGANGVALTVSFTSGGFGPLRLITGGAERARLDASGNLAVGATVAGYRVDIQNNANALRVTGGAAGTACFSTIEGGAPTASPFYAAYTAAGARIGYTGYFDGSKFTVAQTDGAVDLAFGANGTERARLLSGGNFGIGTSGPSQRLEVATAVGDDGIVISNSSTAGGRLRLNSSGAGGRAYHILSTANASGLGGGRFIITDNTAADAVRFAINSSGNTGIGTANPEAVLHTRQDLDGTTGIVVQNRNAAGTPVSSLRFITGGLDLVDNRWAGITSQGVSAPDLRFFTSSGGPVERMRIESGGNVGIGTTSPGARLDVAGTGNFSGALSAASLTLTTALALLQGGTGATTAAGARTNLGAQQALTFTSNANGWAFGLTIGATTYYLQFMPIGALGVNGSVTLTYPVALTSTVMCAQADKYVAGPINDGLNLGPGAPGLTTMSVQNGGTAMSGGYALVIGW